MNKSLFTLALLAACSLPLAARPLKLELVGIGDALGLPDLCRRRQGFDEQSSALRTLHVKRRTLAAGEGTEGRILVALAAEREHLAEIRSAKVLRDSPDDGDQVLPESLQPLMPGKRRRFARLGPSDDRGVVAHFKIQRVAVLVDDLHFIAVDALQFFQNPIKPSCPLRVILSTKRYYKPIPRWVK